jgi:hypothetical protein
MNGYFAWGGLWPPHIYSMYNAACYTDFGLVLVGFSAGSHDCLANPFFFS